EPGPGLDGQLIRAEVAVGVLERAAELRRPAGRGLAGTAVDQIERVALEQARRQVDRGERLAGRALAAEKGERRVVERLHAERDAVDPGCAKRAEALRLARGRVGLEGDLEIGRRGKASGGTLDHRRDRLWRHERRGAAAEEDRAQRTRPDLVGMAVDLGDERARPAGMVDRAADVAVEVAVRALRPAERPEIGRAHV